MPERRYQVAPTIVVERSQIQTNRQLLASHADQSAGDLVCSTLSAAELGECLSCALACDGDALALVDRQSDTLAWRSDAFACQYPDAALGLVWLRWQAACLLPKCSHFLSDDPLIHLAGTQGEQTTLSVHSAGPRHWMLRAQPPRLQSGHLHTYLQQHSELFATSSTLSVSEMATSLAHEINQPVGAITNLLHGMKARLHRDPAMLGELDAAIDSALDQARFTASVITRIRDFTQARRPKMQQQDVVFVLRRALTLLEWLTGGSGCLVVLQLPDQPLHAVCDATLLQQVLINLVRNAVDAMRDVPRTQRLLTVSVDICGSDIRIAINDTGHGLGSAEDSLFVPFATGKPDGMGVGLNICRSFIELHQGRLWLTDSLEGGCTAWITLPLVEHGEAENDEETGI